MTKCNLWVNKEWLFVINFDDWYDVKRNITMTWKTFNFIDVVNTCTAILQWNWIFKVWQFKNLQQKESVIRFVDYSKINESLEKIEKQDINNFKLDYYEAWLSIYQDLDSKEDKVLPYCYKLREKEIEYVKELLWLIYKDKENKVIVKTEESKSKFRYFAYENESESLVEKYTYDNIETMIDKAIESEDMIWIFSFLVWLYTWWYVKVNFTNSVIFQLPISKQLYLHKTIIYKIFAYLKNYFLFSESKWSITQYASNDWEFEKYFQLFLCTIFKDCSQCVLKWEDKELKDDYLFWWYFTNDETKYYKLEQNEWRTKRFIEFLQTIEWCDNVDEFINMVSLSKVKFCTK